MNYNRKMADDSAPVTAEDQQMINKFARLHNNYLSLQEEIKSLLTDIQNVSEAADEVMLLGDEESVPMSIGATFVHYSQSEMDETLEKEKEDREKKLEIKNVEKAVMDTEMKRLKTYLYGKFGDRINLEESDD